MKIKMISSEDKEEWLKETYKYLQKLKEDKYGDVRLDYIMLYELHEEEHKEIERLKAREEEISKMYLAGHKYASEMEDKYILAKYVIDELEKIIKEQEDKIIIEKGQTDNQYNYDLCDSEISAYEYVLNKLKELKEGK